MRIIGYRKRGDNMDNEVIATSAIKMCISVTDYLSPYISERDKEPIWDGNIYVFSKKNKSNESCKGRVPVQVKSKENSDFSKNRITYPIRTDDLHKYLTDNGVMYFVVYVDKEGNSKIYYNDLLPFKLKQLLEDSEGKKTRSTDLKIFPSDNKEKVDLFMNFLRDRELQAGIKNIKLMSVEDLKRMDQLKELSFSFTTTRDDLNYPFEYLFNHSVYLYATVNLGIKVPVDIMSNMYVEQTVNVPVSSNGIQHYDSYSIIHKKDLDELHFGKSTVFHFFKGAATFNFNFNLNGTLKQRIIDEAFLIDLLKSGSLSIGEIVLPIKINNSKELEEFDIESCKKHLEHLKNIQEALERVGVKDELDCHSLSYEDEVHLSMLINAFVDKKEVSFGKPISEPIGKMTIANLCIMLIAREKDNGFYSLSNFFYDHIDIFIEDKNGIYLNTSQFVIMNKDNFLHVSNIDYNSIFNDIVRVKGNSLHYGQINQLLLEMLLAYDESKLKNEKLLQTAYKLSEWLTTVNNDSEDIDILFLNYLQTIKRLRTFNEQELKQLHALIENGNDRHEILTGAYILLEDSSGAQLHYDKLKSEDQVKFAKYPINNLWKKI